MNRRFLLGCLGLAASLPIVGKYLASPAKADRRAYNSYEQGLASDMGQLPWLDHELLLPDAHTAPFNVYLLRELKFANCRTFEKECTIIATRTASGWSFTIDYTKAPPGTYVQSYYPPGYARHGFSTHSKHKGHAATILNQAKLDTYRQVQS